MPAPSPLGRPDWARNLGLSERLGTDEAGQKNPRPMENVLVLVRHGESEWNKLNRFTGWKDVDLTEEGMAEAHRAGAMLKEAGYRFDMAFSSTLKRAHELARRSSSTSSTSADVPDRQRRGAQRARLRRSCRASTRRTRASAGVEQQVHIWQRSYDIAPPGGESLKDTEARVFPFYEKRIVPELHARQERARRRPRQFAAGPDHAARSPLAAASDGGRARDRHAADLSVQCRRQRRREERPRGLSSHC